MQQTLRNVIEFSGIGLHTGCAVNMRILPSAEDTGIAFIRKDIPGSPAIKAESSNVVATSYATSLGAKGVTVSTVEHILSAFYGLGVDNAVVELDGPEVPIMDGSASHFIDMIESAGLTWLSAPRKYIVITRPIKVADRDKYVLLLPAEEAEFSIDYSIDFSHPFLTKQSFSKLFSREVFRQEVGSARTFGFLKDLEMLRANGLAKGASLNNAVAIGDTSIINEDGLRYPDEFVRHKVLDMMGDISLLGAPVIGHLIAHRAGHGLNHRLVNEILKRPGRWHMTDTLVKESSVEPRHLHIEKMATV
ncbi:MAG: UDP-3-O-acyl-N-acetylglucosamine deacetylase [Deltaproteobacteria bacterium]|nr:UDP-3-O-acyl-N-acetylglucosamine deacetylase [Deltaproteobacteria bacterium]